LLVSEDVTPFADPMRRISASFLSLQQDVIAGPELRRVWQQAAQVAALTHPVLILGESGSGKEAVARMIHAMRESPGPFVALNVAAIPEGLFESELFGHVRGAFTGANAARSGAFLQASGGVLFIDEVGDLRPDLQGKLLRALDQMSVRPLGGDRDVPVTARVVAATSHDLKQRCAEGGFRLDLYYRLSGIVIEVPPLRERRTDILALAHSFLQQERTRLRLSPGAAEALLLASWRGNVRELHHVVARASVNAISAGCDEILVEHVPELELLAADDDTRLSVATIEAALAEALGNASQAAKKLGVSRSTLYNVLKRAGIDPSTLRGKR
jgi:two-component system NtrC family response regulator